MKRQNTKLAFSLIELSVVILIVGILVIGVSKGSRIIKSSKLKTAQSLTNSSPVVSTDGILIWVEATLDKSFNSGGAVDTPLANNGTITSWNDINPHITTTNNATQTGGVTAQPRYIASGMNSLPVVNFDGTTDFLAYNGTKLANSDYTVFVVEQRRSGAADSYFLAGASDTNPNTNLHFGYRFNSTITFDQWNGGYDLAIPDYGTQIPRLHALRFSSSKGKNYNLNGISRDGSLTPSGVPVATQGLVSYNSAQIGGRNSSKYAGDIAEVIIFTRYITDSERTNIEKYLKTKWGIK